MHIKRKKEREAKPSNCRGMPQQSVQVARALIASDYANAKDRSTHIHTPRRRHTQGCTHTHTLAHHKLWLYGALLSWALALFGVSLCEKL